MSTHHFPSTGAAYDACQTGWYFRHTAEVEVKTGDVLVIESEKVVGICDTWPVAVTIEFGHLHIPAHGASLASVFEGRKVTAEQIAAAKTLAELRGWPVRD